MSTRARSAAALLAIDARVRQAQVQRTALLARAQATQQRLAQGTRAVGTVLSVLALLAAAGGIAVMLRQRFKPTSDSRPPGRSGSERWLRGLRLATAAIGAARLLAARRPH